MSDASVPGGSPLSLLHRALPDLPPRLREAGQFLSRHEFDAATRSMRDLAAAAGVTPASFTRLAQALGFSGWDALRDALIEARRPPPDAPFSGRLEPGTDDPALLAAAALRADAEGLGRADPAAVARAAAALHAAPVTWVAGFRSCRGIAELLAYQLRLFRPGTARTVGGAGPEDLDFGAFRPGDAAAVIGFAPYSWASVRTARAARAAGCTLVAVADTPEAPIAEGADHLLLFAADGPGFFPSLTGAASLVQALAAATFALGGEPARLRLRETEVLLAAHSQYVPQPEKQP